MAYRIPVYQRQVGAAGLPNYRRQVIQADLTPLARGVQQLATGVAGAIQNTRDRADNAALQNAKTKAAELRLQYEKMMDESHGLETLQRGSTVHEEFNQKLDELGEDLKLSPRVMAQWQSVRDNEYLGFRRSVNGRVVREADALEEASYAANIKTNADKAAVALTNGNGDEFRAIVQDTDNAAALRAAHHHMPNDVAEAARREAVTPVFVAGIDSLLDRGDWRAAQQLRDAAAEKGVDQSKLNTFDKLIKAKKLDEMVEEESSKILQGSRHFGTGSSEAYDLTAALRLVDNRKDFTPEERKEVRDAVVRKYQQQDLALREKDAPTMGILVENIWRSGISPYSPKMAKYMESLEPERRDQMAKEWYSYKRSRKNASAEDRRAQNELDRIRTEEFKVMLMDENPVDPNDYTERFFVGVSGPARARMKTMFRAAKGMTPGDKQYVNGRIDAFVLDQELDGADAKEVKRRVSNIVSQHVRENHGKFDKDELRSLVESELLSWQAKRANYWYGDDEERAREDIGESLDVFNPQAEEAPPAAEEQMSASMREKIRAKIADKKGVPLDQVTDDEVLSVYGQLKAKGGIK